MPISIKGPVPNLKTPPVKNAKEVREVVALFDRLAELQTLYFYRHGNNATSSNLTRNLDNARRILVDSAMKADMEYVKKREESLKRNEADNRKYAKQERDRLYREKRRAAAKTKQPGVRRLVKKAA